MPPYPKAISKKQRKLAGIAEHHPGMVMGRNRSILGMKKTDLHGLASTKEKGLVAKVKSTSKR